MCELSRDTVCDMRVSCSPVFSGEPARRADVKFRVARLPMQYEDGETVEIYYNKIGPFHNPSERYDYLAKGFCRANDDNPMRIKFDGFGQYLQGNNLVNTDYEVKFKVDKEKTFICELKEMAQGRAVFRMVQDDYYVEYIAGGSDAPCRHRGCSWRDCAPNRNTQ